jgi:integrase
MATLSVVKRGKSFHLKYRLGGRGWPLEHGGAFKTKAQAIERRNLVAGEIAQGRNPKVLLDAMRHPAEPVKRETVAEIAERYLQSRRDVSTKTAASHKGHVKRINAVLGERDPQSLSVADCDSLVAALAEDMKPGSVKLYYSTFKQLLDFAEVEPNPARSRSVRLPSVVHEEANPPTAKQFLAILDNVPERWRLPMIVMEQTAMRVGEAASLTWGDVDVAESKFRLRGSNTKTRKSRMVQVPEWLMDEIAATCPLEDRTAERKVFLGFTGNSAKNAMTRACKVAEIPHFHPHDLRHRRGSLWHGQGVVARELANRLGHSKASMSLDVYSHVLMDGTEVEQDAYAAILSR